MDLLSQQFTTGSSTLCMFQPSDNIRANVFVSEALGQFSSILLCTIE